MRIFYLTRACFFLDIPLQYLHDTGKFDPFTLRDRVAAIAITRMRYLSTECVGSCLIASCTESGHILSFLIPRPVPITEVAHRSKWGRPKRLGVLLVRTT